MLKNMYKNKAPTRVLAFVYQIRFTMLVIML